MDEQQTVRSRISGLPLRGIKLEVTEGPDLGRTHVATTERVTVGTAEGNDLLLTDPTVSRYHLELVRSGDRVQVIDHGSTNGIVVGGVFVEKGSLPAGSTLVLGKTKIKVEDGTTVTLEMLGEDHLGGVLGRSPSMRLLMARVEKVAPSDHSVLLLGESGTGKELLARAIHDASPRVKKPFVTVDCASLQPTLVASELFGHERGAFTGADKRHIGAFEQAQGGTVFLDEIGEMPPALQSALLGALERRRFRRVGGKEEVSVDVRVIAATNRDLRAEVNRNTFRLDLYYRLAVVLLAVPPLRERPDDIPALVEHFLREAGHDGRVEDLISQATMQALSQHHWPGNVRELRNLVEATLAMGEIPRLDLDSAPAAAPETGSATPPVGVTYKDARRIALEDFEARFLRPLLERTKGNVSLAAREAQMDRSHLIDLLRRHGIK